MLQLIETTTKSPQVILTDLKNLGLADLREFLSILYANYTTSKEWQEATNEWRETCGANYRELVRALEEMDRAK